MIVAGFSAYSQVVDWARFRAIADKVGAYLFVDMAHVAGLVAAGVYPNPVPHAHVVTSTTHKTLRGPRGGIIVAKGADEELEKKLQCIVFPGIQGGPLMHVIAAKAVAFKEALEPEFKTYQQQVVKNAQAMAKTIIARGYKIVSGGTENHLMLVDMIGKDVTGKDAEAALGKAHITVNKNAVPNDPHSPFVTSGLRIGTPAVTTRGYHGTGLRGAGELDLRRAGRAGRRERDRRRARERDEAVRAVSGLRLKTGSGSGSECARSARASARSRFPIPIPAPDALPLLPARRHPRHRFARLRRRRDDPPPARVRGLRRAFQHAGDHRDSSCRRSSRATAGATRSTRASCAWASSARCRSGRCRKSRSRRRCARSSTSCA